MAVFLSPWCIINPAHIQLSVKHLKWVTSVSLSTLKATASLGVCCTFLKTKSYQQYHELLLTSLTSRRRLVFSVCGTIHHHVQQGSQLGTVSKHVTLPVMSYVCILSHTCFEKIESAEDVNVQSSIVHVCRSQLTTAQHLTLTTSSLSYIQNLLEDMNTSSTLKLSLLVMMTPLMKLKNTGLSVVGLH